MTGQSIAKSFSDSAGAQTARSLQHPRGKRISPPVVSGLLGFCDGAAVLAAGFFPFLGDGVDVFQPFAVHPFTVRPLIGLVVAVGTLLALNLLHLAGAYRFETLKRMPRSLGAAVLGWMLTAGTLIAILHLTGASTAATQQWLSWWSGGAMAALCASRFGLALATRQWQRAGRLCHVVAVVGAGPIAQQLIRRLAKSDPDLEIVGVYDDRASRVARFCQGIPIVGTVDDLLEDARRCRIDTVLVALPLSADRRLAGILNKLAQVPVDVRLCPDLFGFHLGTCPVSQLGGLTMLHVLDRPLRDWREIAKDIEDRVLASLILLAILPLMLAIAAAIKLDSPGPVFFRQKRYGLNNELIEIWKFRTMHHHARDPNAEQLTRRNDPRVTRVGAFLRRTSLDELPQFINVLRGEMSVVGPRPHALSAKAGGLLYPEAVKYYDARHRVRPGITGWAQINGWRGETETVEQIAKRVEHDLYYIENWSVLLDLKIVLRTIVGGFAGHNAF